MRYEIAAISEDHIRLDDPQERETHQGQIGAHEQDPSNPTGCRTHAPAQDQPKPAHRHKREHSPSKCRGSPGRVDRLKSSGVGQRRKDNVPNEPEARAEDASLSTRTLLSARQYVDPDPCHDSKAEECEVNESPRNTKKAQARDQAVHEGVDQEDRTSRKESCRCG